MPNYVSLSFIVAKICCLKQTVGQGSIDSVSDPHENIYIYTLWSWPSLLSNSRTFCTTYFATYCFLVFTHTYIHVYVSWLFRQRSTNVFGANAFCHLQTERGRRRSVKKIEYDTKSTFSSVMLLSFLNPCREYIKFGQKCATHLRRHLKTLKIYIV